MALPVRGIALSILVAALLGTGAAAQVSSPFSPGLRTAPLVLPPSRAEPNGDLVLEGPVDPDRYTLGPGDVFTVSIGGSQPRQTQALVAADGSLVVPEVGTFRAAGRTITAVRSEVRAALRTQFRSAVDIALTEPRRFYVHVSGAVPEPGRRLVRGIARVGDAIEEAAGESLPGLASYGFSTPRGTPVPALRSVRVTHPDGTVETVDLLLYLRGGVVEANPYLRDGDAVYLPQFNPTLEGVAVNGAVDRPGIYDVRAGDTAADLLAVAVGPEATARVASVRRTRLGAAGVPESVEVPASEAARLDVRPRDQFSVVSVAPDASSAEVVGAVEYPGVYPITAGTTRLSDLVEMAGGLRPDALLRATYLERPSRSGLAQQGETEVGETIPSDIAVADDLLDNLFSRRFYVQEVGSVPRVSVNVERALSGDEPVTLREGDRLVVPFDRSTVRVYGRVVRPGFVPFVPGRRAADYVAEAGGTGVTAAAIYVVDAATGQFVRGESVPVQPGDDVFVNSLAAPDTPELATLALQERQSQREDRRDARQARYQLIQTVIAVVGTVLTAILAISALNDPSSN